VLVPGWFGNRVFQRRPWLKVRFSFNVYFPSIWRSEGERVTLVIIRFGKRCASKKIVAIEKDHCGLTLSHHPVHNCGQPFTENFAKKNKKYCFLLVEYSQKNNVVFHLVAFVDVVQYCFLYTVWRVRQTVNEKLCSFIGTTQTPRQCH